MAIPFRYDLPHNPFCKKAEASFYSEILCGQSIRIGTIKVNSKLEKIIIKEHVGLNTSLMLTGPLAGFIITTDVEYNHLSQIGRPLLSTPSKIGTIAVANEQLFRHLKLNLLKYLKVCDSVNNYCEKFLLLLDKKGINIDESTFLSNVSAYTSWAKTQHIIE